MSSFEVKVPNVGVDGDVEIVEICVAPGDTVELDSPLVVLESDKATVEVPSPNAGKVDSLAVKVGDKVREGALVLVMSLDEENEKAEQEADKPIDTQLVDAQLERKETLQVVVPDLGGSDGVEVIEILASGGDELSRDQAIIVLESDKATMEIPCTESGILKSLNVKVGDKVSQGDLIAELEVTLAKENTQPSESDVASEELRKSERNPPTPQAETPSRREESNQVISQIDPGSKVHAGPAVRKFAREHGVELSRVTGTGPRNRILKEDLRDYIKSQVQMAQSGSGSGLGLPEVELPDFSAYGEVELLKMDRLHKLTAKNMQASWLTVPHVTQFDEADITDLEVFRKDHKIQAEQKGVKLTPVAFIIKACAYALQQLPQFNVSLDMKNEQIVQKKYIHIGLAVDTPAGLVVPVIRDADRKSLWEIASDCQDLAERAKLKKLSPADMQGACFTISSLGALGGTAFTPIVNTPEVAILGVSKAQIKPVWDGTKDFIPRLMLPLSLSYDHRAVNGADAARFTTLLSQVLGDLRELLL
jgi:pyruvate dehydrogenase E2 component (dihydrolipoamide acetyltransferase)